MGLMENKAVRRQIALACILCLLPLVAWYSKNLVMFGFWGPSSWVGTNVVQVASQIVKEPEIKEMQAAGLLSTDFPAIYDIKKITGRVPPDSLVDQLTHVSLQPYKYADWPNYNYLGMLSSSRQDLRL